MYKAINVDTDKALKAIAEARKRAQTEEILKQREIQKFYEGYHAGLDMAEDIFSCTNYEKDDADNAWHLWYLWLVEAGLFYKIGDGACKRKFEVRRVSGKEREENAEQK